jgi:hypothetical protein
MILNHINDLIYEALISKEERANNRLNTIKTLNKFTLYPTIIGGVAGGSIGKMISALDPSTDDYPMKGYILGASAGAVLGNIGALAISKYLNSKITDLVKPKHFGNHTKECEDFIQDIFSLYYPILSDVTNISYKAEVYNLYTEYLQCMNANDNSLKDVRKCYIYLAEQLLHDLTSYLNKNFTPEYEKVLKDNLTPRFNKLKQSLL